MLTPNGGVFGRNPKFNTVTVQNGISVAGGSIVVSGSGQGIDFSSTSDPSIPATAARGALQRTATNVSNNDTVTIGSITYTFKTTLTPANYEVLIGADAATSLLYLSYAILGTGGTPGTDYVVPGPHPTVTAEAISGNYLPIVALTAGTAGNAIATTETSAQLSFARAALTGGTNAGGSSGELLADYEVGTWTPSYSPATGTFGVISYESTTAGTYVKIGNLVTVQCNILTTDLALGTASGNIRISGLPYAASVMSSGIVGYSEFWTSAPSAVQVAASATVATLSIKTTANGATARATTAALSVGSASRNIVEMTMTYQTA